MDTKRPSGLRRLIGKSVIASAGILASPAEAAATSGVTQTPDSSLLGLEGEQKNYADGLKQLDPFDATCAAALAATSSDRNVRWVLARSLAAEFPLVGARLILEHLAADPEDDVRLAALHAIAVRRAHRHRAR
jgi:hypothetical protein